MKASRKVHRIGGTVLALGVVVGLAHWPTTTRYGINYRWASRRIPLYEKTINFLSRHLQTKRLAEELTRGAANDEEKLLTLFQWVGAHVQPTPKGFPVVDDHPLYILIRGYGAEDQRTEAFALLAHYAGFSSSVARLKAPGTGTLLHVALVRQGIRHLVFDITHQLVFRTAQGELAGLEELRHDPVLLASASQGLLVDGVPYERFFLAEASLSSYSRSDAQELWPRLWQMMRRLVQR